MRRITTLIVFYLLTSAVFAQDYEPQILILAPNETSYDKEFGKELRKINDDLSKSPKFDRQKEYTESAEFAKKPENIKLMTLSQAAFSEDLDFFRQTSLIAHGYLTYRFYERFTNLLILLSTERSSGKLNDLKALADRKKIQYILNFPRIDLYSIRGVGYAKIRVQLYDNLAGEYLIDKDFEGDWLNPGFEFSCKEKTISCMISNTFSKALPEVVENIAWNSPTLKREKELSQQRFVELVEHHFSKPSNVEPLRSIIQESDKNIALDHIFQVLYNDSKTKFVAFSLEQISGQDFKTFKDQQKDKSVNIITGKDIKDKGFFDEMPRMYGYIIKGVKYNDKWYYEKANVTYFDDASVEEARKTYFNDLQKWGFFIENTSMMSPAFWEANLFDKVRDLRQDPDWEKYGASIWKTEEANNREYVGMYEIVANVMRRRRMEENDKFEEDTKEKKLRPKYKQLTSNNPALSKYTDQSLIYPGDRSVVINPVLLSTKKGVHTLHYFVAFAGSDDLYEWTYFPPEEVKNSGFFGSTVVDRLSTVTTWNFSFDTLDDKNFWNTYVLLKEGDNFKYLKKVQP